VEHHLQSHWRHRFGTKRLDLEEHQDRQHRHPNLVEHPCLAVRRSGHWHLRSLLDIHHSLRIRRPKEEEGARCLAVVAMVRLRRQEDRRNHFAGSLPGCRLHHEQPMGVQHRHHDCSHRDDHLHHVVVAREQLRQWGHAAMVSDHGLPLRCHTRQGQLRCVGARLHLVHHRKALASVAGEWISLERFYGEMQDLPRIHGRQRHLHQYVQ